MGDGVPPLRAAAPPALRIIRLDTRIFADAAFRVLDDVEALGVIRSFASTSPDRRFTRYLGVPVSLSNGRGR